MGAFLARYSLLASTLLFSVSLLASTQQVNFNSISQVYVGDLVNEASASLDQAHAPALCNRLVLGSTISDSSDIETHGQNCIFHIVRFNDLAVGATDVQSVAAQNWYVYSNAKLWSLEDLSTNKRLLGNKHVSIFFIFLNRAFAVDQPIATPANLSTPLPENSPLITGPCIAPKLANVSQAAGSDNYTVLYTITVTGKISANVQQLIGLLGAAGVQTTGTAPDGTQLGSIDVPSNMLSQARVKNISGSATPKTTVDRISILSDGRLQTASGQVTAVHPSLNAKDPTCMDAVFGGGTVDIDYRPSDISIAGTLTKSAAPNVVSVPINANPYVVDNEGYYYVDFSVPVALKKLNQVQYTPTGTETFSPINTATNNAYYGIDLFPAKVDVKTNTWPKWPGVVAGAAFASQPLHNILLAGTWGPLFSQVFVGVSFVDQPRVAAHSSSCNAAAGGSTSTVAPFGYHFCTQFSIGLNMTVTGFASKLGAPK